MKRAIVVILALGILWIAGLGIVSQLKKERGASQQELADQESARRQPNSKTGQANQPRRRNQELQDPGARDALSLVGTDPKAEEYWLKAINNPNLPAKERQDLIEDLNEEGFADPKHPTAEELPLILKRLAIIEKIEAMDDVNAAALKEAHKDLTQMRDRLRAPATGQ